MSPDKLFDYLDGKLPAEERAKIEQQLASDPHLQRELAVARRIHSSIPDSREVFGQLETRSTTNRGAVLGQRVAIAFAALVFLNVLFGIYAIAFMEKKRRAPPAEEQNRQQLVQALENTAASALPTPKLDVDEIRVDAPVGQRDAVVNKVVALAAKSGGSLVYPSRSSRLQWCAAASIVHVVSRRRAARSSARRTHMQRRPPSAYREWRSAETELPRRSGLARRSRSSRSHARMDRRCR